MGLLTVSGLRVTRGDRTLLDNLSFVVGSGDVLHFKGRNGVGKTSLIEVLVGLRPPAAGSVSRGHGAAFHWLGHRNALSPDLSLEENLADWCRLNELPTSPVAPALERLGLGRLRSRSARKLSMGQKRRAALARLCLEQRPLWLLDEPLSGLDSDGIQRFGELLTAHVEQGGGVLLTSHQPLPGTLPRVTEVDIA